MPHSENISWERQIDNKWTFCEEHFPRNANKPIVQVGEAMHKIL